jgi:hypothetical protein
MLFCVEWPYLAGYLPSQFKCWMWVIWIKNMRTRGLLRTRWTCCRVFFAHNNKSNHVPCSHIWWIGSVRCSRSTPLMAVHNTFSLCIILSSTSSVLQEVSPLRACLLARTLCVSGDQGQAEPWFIVSSLEHAYAYCLVPEISFWAHFLHHDWFPRKEDYGHEDANSPCLVAYRLLLWSPYATTHIIYMSILTLF